MSTNLQKLLDEKFPISVLKPFLSAFLKAKKEAERPKGVKLRPEDMTRLTLPYTPKWREIYHWIPKN
jgi:hypothetical protein